MKKILIVGANGYVGTRLYDELEKNKINVTGIDNFLRKDIDHFNSKVQNINYQDLDKISTNDYTDCIWLSGYSSVVESEKNQREAFFNNFVDLVKFYHSFEGRFIYASSGSVYSRDVPELCNESSQTSQPQNIYDYTKLAFDNYLISTKSDAIGLRFGTVNGPGNNMKKELMLNAMVLSGLKNSKIVLKNENFHRPILGIEDLINGIIKITQSDIKGGIFNMCSFNTSIGDLANKISQMLNVKIDNQGSTETYNFMMNNDKFESTFDFTFTETIESIVNSLVSHYDSLDSK